MNFKNKMLNFLLEGKKIAIEDYVEVGKSTEAISKAFDLTYAIIEKRFNNEIKQYNNNVERACDEFVARKNLEYLNIFVEEFLLLDREEHKLYKEVRKHMRDLVHNLYLLVNKQLE